MSGFDYLRHIPVFEELADAELARISRIITARLYKRNTIIFTEGETGEGLHFVQSGKVKILHLAADGREHIPAILGEGEIFAEVLLFNRGPYPATAVAMEDSIIGMIRNTELEQLVASHSELALQLIRVMNKKLLQAQAKIRTLALADSFTRTAQTLERLARQYGRPEAGGIRIEADITRQELANLAGTTRETASRVLSALKKEQVIDLSSQRILILDSEKLNRYSGL